MPQSDILCFVSPCDVVVTAVPSVRRCSTATTWWLQFACYCKFSCISAWCWPCWTRIWSECHATAYIVLFWKGLLTPFPILCAHKCVHKTVNSFEILINVHYICSCNKPYLFENDCIECDLCKVWFHRDCEHVSLDLFNEWSCTTKAYTCIVCRTGISLS